jgi:hypothetical protein
VEEFKQTANTSRDSYTTSGSVDYKVLEDDISSAESINNVIWDMVDALQDGSSEMEAIAL